MSNNNTKEMKPSSFRPFMREKVQLVIEPSAAFTDGVNPLSATHEKFSRFNFAVINEGKCATMNMRFFSDTPDEANSYVEFRELANLAKEMHLKAKFTPKKGAATPAFMLVFKAGRDTQGKTAVQVLKDNANGRDILSKQRDFLQQNVAKYQSNQQYIDAIDEALKLSKEQINSADDSMVITLFKSGLRSNGYKKNKNGKVLCYDGSIVFYPGAESPLKVSIVNYYANTEKTDRGLDKILVNTAEDKKEGSINLNFGEALRLFTELEEYFTIKFDELSRYGIAESEKLLKEQRTQSSDDSDSDASDEAVESNSTSSTESEKQADVQSVNDTAPAENKTNTVEIFTESAFQKITDNVFVCDFKAKMKDGTKGNSTYRLVMDKDKFIGDGDSFNMLFKNASTECTLVKVMYEEGELEGNKVYNLIDIL